MPRSHRNVPVPAAVLAAILATLPARKPQAAGLEVLEVGADTTAASPRGKEADGIIGDLVLRNEHIEALVAGNLPLRKANMSTFYDDPTPGCLYDLCVRGSANDQLTYMGPAGLRGPVSYVRILGAAEAPPGCVAVRVERTGPAGGGRRQVHDYLLAERWRHLRILSTYRNEGREVWKVQPVPVFKGLSGEGNLRGIWVGDSMNPRDRQAYAAAVCEWQGGLEMGPPAPPEVAIPPGEERRFLTAVAPAGSPAEAFGIIADLRGETGELEIVLRDAAGPVVTARVRIHLDARQVLPAYPGDDGRIAVRLPPGTYLLVAEDLGRPPVERSVTVAPGGQSAIDLALEPPSRITLEVTEAGTDPPRKLPSKVQFVGIGGTPSPQLGVDIQARGCRNQYHAESGHFTQQLPPGEYRIIITRGIEYDHAEREVKLSAGQSVTVSAQLRRIVDTTGWVSTDFHNHSTPSGDNYCGTDDRVINLAAEHIEFAPTTEHNRFYDWTPHIERLGLSWTLATTVGVELTGPNAHFNAFPFEVRSFVQDGGAPVWQHDPRIDAIVLRDYQGGGPNRWVHLNHPSVGQFFRDRDADGVADGGYAGLEDLIDAAEVWSLEILNPTPWLVSTDASGKTQRRENRTFAWLQLLNQGRRMWCLAVSDAHSVFGNGVGGWRTYVPSSTDDPSRIDPAEIIRNARAGRMFVTTGPFLDVRLDDGTLPGGYTVARGPIVLQVTVQCTDWIDIDRVQVLVNGRIEPALNFTRQSHPGLFSPGVVKFRHAVPLVLHEDAHIIVASVGEGSDLRTGYGESWQSGMHPCAFTDPLWIDTDGHGFEPSGDTLGHPLPLGRYVDR